MWHDETISVMLQTFNRQILQTVKATLKPFKEQIMKLKRRIEVLEVENVSLKEKLETNVKAVNNDKTNVEKSKFFPNLFIQCFLRKIPSIMFNK